MSINTFKKTMLVSSLLVIAISANAQDREEEHSRVSTGLKASVSEMRSGEAAQEVTPSMGLASVVVDQLVTKPLKGLLSTVEAFGKFAYQHPVAAFTVTAAYALPVVAALLPEQAPHQWYPQFTCAKSPDIQQITTFVGSGTVILNFAPANGMYQFTPNTRAQGYPTATQCAYATEAYWYGPATANTIYKDGNCTDLFSNSY